MAVSHVSYIAAPMRFVLDSSCYVSRTCLPITRIHADSLADLLDSGTIAVEVEFSKFWKRREGSPLNSSSAIHKTCALYWLSVCILPK